MKRILVIATANHLFGVSQGKMDRDSAIIYAADIFGLSRLLAYNEGFSSGKNYPGQALIDAGKINEAAAWVTDLRGDPQMQLLAELATYYLHKPGTEPSDINNAGIYLKKLTEVVALSQDKHWQVSSLWLLAEWSSAGGDMERSNDYYSQAIALLRKSPNKKMLINGLLLHAQNLPLSDPKRAAELEEGIHIAKAEKLPQMQYRVSIVQLLDLMRLHPAKFEAALLAVLELEKQIGFEHHQYVYSSLSYWKVIQGDLVKSREYAVASLASAAQTRDTALSVLYNTRMGDLTINSSNPEEAIYWNDRAQRIPKTKETQIIWYKSLIQRIRIYAANNDYAKALSTAKAVAHDFPPDNDFDQMQLLYHMAYMHDKVGESDQALKYYLEFLEISERYPPQFMYTELLNAYCQLAAFYVRQHEGVLARKYATRVINDPIGKVAPPYLASASHTLFKLDSMAGNYVSAIQHYQDYHRYSDSTFSITQRQKFDELTVQYETQQKDQKLQLLERNGELQEARLNRSSLIGNITMAGIAVLLIVVGLLYNQYRLKQKVNAETEARNKILQQLVEEKEWLIREVHHRVKNNLQTIVSLLESQSTYLQNEALQAIQESQNRIHAMSLIHQKLYHDENISAVSMATYLPELVEYLSESYNINSRILFYTKVEDVELDVSQAIPLGLVVNEAITNAIKYAFPHPEPGNSITVNFSMAAGRLATLTIADNGVGIDKALLHTKAKGLGLRLIRGLAKDIDAQLEMRADHGTMVMLTFTVSHTLKADTVQSSTQLV
ncbi:histidine kinase dimerization/phosphoacceptor domain -containing protein [Chitinophaga sp. sic0106]|uniref:histidine kinase dimerization/phosphoacceptor domain -containing protein n=1 Tax=Chitinophaga sp. sic0106 TaxID=2854785 RepID=UPI001C47A896|nr:histidine kinase dimerization/phosphoacceptor domain -containing protein [Chitinophaga sp. sic0106]MBV7529788.1 ATP-binding protein [Chitinophaga sp. sic0106]